jgi:AraC family transcriptional regulator of adaptative response / DNA-3-methyladenine glycosylase II
MLGYLAGRAIAGVEHVSTGVYRRTVTIDGEPGVLELSSGPADQLRLRVDLPPGGGLDPHRVQRARQIFNLDADATDATALLSADPIIGSLLQTCPGVRPPGTWDPYETGVRAIAGQLVSVAAANTVIARLVQRHGTRLPGLRTVGLSHLFPSAHELAGADLTGLGLPPVRARAINAFARAVADGEVVLDRSRTLDELVTSITAIAGLGPWTAHYLALRLGESDAFPATDLGLRRALEHRTGERITGAAANRLAERWRPHRAHAVAQLWFSDRGASVPEDVAARPH